MMGKGQEAREERKERGYDIHPLIREYFASVFDEKEKRDCQEAIYRNLEKNAPQNPMTDDFARCHRILG